jgi:hypothetical protein
MNFKIKGWGGVILLSAAMLGGAHTQCTVNFIGQVSDRQCRHDVK